MQLFNPSNRRKQAGGILFFLLIVIVLIVVGTIIVGLYKMSKKVNQPFKPKWDDVNWTELDQQAESMAMGGEEETGDHYAVAYRRYIVPGFKIWIFSSDSLVPPDGSTIQATMAAEAQAQAEANDPSLAFFKSLDKIFVAEVPTKNDAKAGFKPVTKAGGAMQRLDFDPSQVEGFVSMTSEEFENWQMPEPDPTKPAHYYHQYMEELHPQEEEIEGGSWNSQFPF
jgi:hypothetical protein